MAARLILVFAAGAAIGSFVHALAWRLRRGRDVIKERSECERCGHTLAVVDLIPVLSWLLLRGRCRHCHGRISPAHVVVEAAGGTALALVYLWSAAPPA
jgi:leader peptidase (prepilin peptidase)/N-methyltransferase